mmetsp:Transcript_12143/g.34151  ORF Transcript_12143/g.34151 Transcript_12143/m.34151 type:complete len:628 (-) Transcript_12143:809-2692(-)
MPLHGKAGCSVAAAGLAAVGAAAAAWGLYQRLVRRRQAPSGTWRSAIRSKLIAGKFVRLSSVWVVPDGAVFWLEGRPQEGGRRVLVSRSTDGTTKDVTPAELNVWTRVHEYGGGDYTVSDSKVAYFVNRSDQQVYRQALEGAGSATAVQVTSTAASRYADLEHCPGRGCLFAVCETHGGGEPVNNICSIDLTTGKVTAAVEGADFFSSPRVSRDGRFLAWVSWDHPSMPWDITSLWTAEIGDGGSLGPKKRVSLGTGESVLQPEWLDDGSLVFISDRSGWWNLYQHLPGKTVRPICKEMKAEFGGPSWMFGWRHYCVLPGNCLLAAVSDPHSSRSALLLIDAAVGVMGEVASPYTDYGFSLFARQVSGRLVVACVGGSYTKPEEVAVLEVSSVSELLAVSCSSWRCLQKSMPTALPECYISAPQKICFPTAENEVSYMLFYRPKNTLYTLPEGVKPALLVNIHGGPTGFAAKKLKLEVQFWTSRGFAVADIDYRGSAGYGREYRDKLKGNWGITDVEDCVSAAQHLVSQGLVDPDRLCINGGSAGGFTVLAALLGESPFKAGACRYGVADMELLAQETHKFESHYLDSLVGPYPQVQSQHPTQEDASLLCQSSATWQGRKAFLRNAA